jgi:pimeloyl-ACP methyl ester carboxylesterase
MVVRARRDLRSRARRAFLYPVLGVLVVASLGGGYETIQEAVDRSALASPGQLVDVGGHRMFLECSGSGSPTVVMEAGLWETSDYYTGWITPAVSPSTRVCVYDRAGSGRSEPAAAVQDGAAVAADLHALLERAHVAGPYVLAAHSTGGPYARIYAARYSDQVAGMVLLDSQPNTAFKLPGYPSIYSTLRIVTALLPSFARLGVLRLVSQFGAGTLPAPARDRERADLSTANSARRQRDDTAEIPTSLNQATALKSLGDRPLIVVTAVKDAQEGWVPPQNDLARLSTNSVHVLADTTHLDLIEQQASAAIASKAILDVVDSVRTGRPLGR